MNIIIDGNKINTIEQLHLEFKNTLNLPSYYGMNLDALDECLDDFTDLHVSFINTSKLCYNLKKYFFDLLDLLKDHDAIVSIKVND